MPNEKWVTPQAMSPPVISSDTMKFFYSLIAAAVVAASDAIAQPKAVWFIDSVG
jgi:hypothetical protein